MDPNISTFILKHERKTDINNGGVRALPSYCHAFCASHDRSFSRDEPIPTSVRGFTRCRTAKTLHTILATPSFNACCPVVPTSFPSRRLACDVGGDSESAPGLRAPVAPRVKTPSRRGVKNSGVKIGGRGGGKRRKRHRCSRQPTEVVAFLNLQGAKR